MELTCAPGGCDLEITTKGRTYFCKCESEVAAQEWYTKIYSSQFET